MSSKKGPIAIEASSLIATFNNGLAARTVLVLLLDYGCTLGGLTLVDHGGTVPLTVAVVVSWNSPVSLGRREIQSPCQMFRESSKERCRSLPEQLAMPSFPSGYSGGGAHP
jgi:hypothetical protein